MNPVECFDWKHPDYVGVYKHRIEKLAEIRSDRSVIPALKSYYRSNPAQFIVDWGCTTDPRNVEIGLPAVIPFILFPRQREWIDWVLDSWHTRQNGATPKSRESGVSWLAVALSATLCLFNDNMAIGFGSRKEEYVDKIGDPKALFWKARKFLELLPVEFRGGFNAATDSPHMRIIFRGTDSIITGEAGDNIGRGDRAGLYFVDEAAYLAHPDLADAALSQTTNCRIDVSTANGLGGSFHRKVTTWAKERVFQFHWRDDPRKDQAWYNDQVSKHDPVVIAQEIDIDFAASVEGVLIPSAWVQAAIDANVKLAFLPSGIKSGALDIADEGRDKNAFCGAHGVVLERIEEWSGKGDDIFGTVVRAFGLCDELGYNSFRYDADGLGAGVRGDSRVINSQRLADGRRQLVISAFRGSDGVYRPEAEDVKGRKNIDYFANAKAQSGWALRTRFQKTFRAVTQGVKISHDELISIPSGLKNREKLVAELSQPTYSFNDAGKMVINKAPEGTLSPNLYDAVMIRYSTVKVPLMISEEAMAMAARR